MPFVPRTRNPAAAMLDWFEHNNNPPCYRISGVTRDATLNPIGGCIVEVYEAVPGPSEPRGQLRGTTVSDGSGNFSIDVTSGETGIQYRCTARSSTGSVASVTGLVAGTAS